MKPTSLSADSEFADLIAPLSMDGYRELERQLLRDGCTEPILVWHGTIVKGQVRHQICKRHNILFTVQDVTIKSKEDVVIWLCVEEGRRTDITHEMHWYLIGKRYAAEKLLAAQKLSHKNQYSKISNTMLRSPMRSRSMYRTADPLGVEYHVSGHSIQNYATYSVAVDKIARIDRWLRDSILAGWVQISQDKVIQISGMGGYPIKAIADALRVNPSDKLLLKGIGQRTSPINDILEHTRHGSVKNMPAYDPDTEISALTFTIPSWRTSMERVQRTTKMEHISDLARCTLTTELLSLSETVSLLLNILTGGNTR